jgi:hypothetical protein
MTIRDKRTLTILEYAVEIPMVVILSPILVLISALEIFIILASAIQKLGNHVDKENIMDRDIISNSDLRHLHSGVYPSL